MDPIFLIAIDDGINVNNIIENIVQEIGYENVAHEEIRRRNPRPKNENYYEVIIPRYTDVQFIEHFRMSRNTFQVCIIYLYNAFELFFEHCVIFVSGNYRNY